MGTRRRGTARVAADLGGGGVGRRRLERGFGGTEMECEGEFVGSKRRRMRVERPPPGRCRGEGDFTLARLGNLITRSAISRLVALCSSFVAALSLAFLIYLPLILPRVCSRGRVRVAFPGRISGLRGGRGYTVMSPTHWRVTAYYSQHVRFMYSDRFLIQGIYDQICITKVIRN